MKAAFFRQHGGPEVLEVGELPDPVAGPGEVLLRVRAAALNHIDLWLRRGLPALRVPFPHVAGGDICGDVVGLGAGVTTWQVGTRVVVNPGVSCGMCEPCQSGHDNLCAAYKLVGEGRWGGEAELVVVPAANLVAAPAGVADEILAAVPIVYLTAWHMLVDRAALRAGETVLIWGAASGVGSAAIQIARLHGARVIACASTEAKRQAAAAQGADVCLPSDPPSPAIAGEVRRLTAGRGADVVFEHTGAATFPLSIRAAARGGRIVTCGATAGAETPLDLRHVFWRQLSILGATLAPRGRLHRLLALVAEGKLQPRISGVMGLEQIADAHRALEARQVLGKLVLRVAA